MARSDWKEIHDQLVDIANAQAELDYDIGCGLLEALRAGVDQHLGYGSIREYGAWVFGYSHRLVEERLRVARALETLPALTAALRGNELPWSALRELTRVADETTETVWLDAARGKTVRQIEELVAGRKRGDRPTDPVDDQDRRHVLRFEVSGRTLALVRDAQAKVTRDTGHHVTDDEMLEIVARQVLGGPADEGRATHPIAVWVCPRCERASQQAGGEEVAIDAVDAERAQCDAQHLDTHVGAPTRASQSIPPAVRRLVMRRDHGRCVVPGCRNRIVDCHHLRRRVDGGGHGSENVVVACTVHHAKLHAGAIRVEGTPSSGLQFFHADGSGYGRAPDAHAVEAFTEAFTALRRLGFSEREVNAALARIRTASPSITGTEQVLREALASLRTPRRA